MCRCVRFSTQACRRGAELGSICTTFTFLDMTRDMVLEAIHAIERRTKDGHDPVFPIKDFSGKQIFEVKETT